jgi:NAD(P)-dependent dehydrogenase (short-subunit alcohol dehydrogenase family)
MKRLSGKVAIITGAGQGVGLGIARRFAKEGASLLITGRDEEKLNRVVAELQNFGTEVSVYAGDVRRRQDAERAVRQAADRFGQIDILVNNAQSSVPGKPFEEMDDETMRMTFESGVMGSILHMQAVFPHMKSRGGSIINFGSYEGVYGGPGFGIYAATKEGIRGLSRVAAREWGKYNIRTNVVCPAALSEKVAKYFNDFPGEEAKACKDIALGRLGDSEDDIGPAVVFLASDESRYITGQTINVEGGLSML